MPNIPIVVIDTNILISSLWGGKPRQIIDLWAKRKIMCAVSPDILEEYTQVLARFNPTAQDMDEFITLFLNPSCTILVKPKIKLNIIKQDPSDNKFIECAVAAKVNYITSGDKALLEVKNYKKIKIITAGKFLRRGKS